MSKIFLYIGVMLCSSIALNSCKSEPETGPADMLHGCFKDSHISSLNQALKATDALLEQHYKLGDPAKNYQAYVKAMSERENKDSPIYDKSLKRIFRQMRDNRVFYEILTKYELSYLSHRQAAGRGMFKLYLLDYEKPFFTCWLNKVENPIIKSYLTGYKNTPAIDPKSNIWYEVDNMSVVFEEDDFKNPETRLYVAVYGLYHLAFMLNPDMMVDLD